MKYPGDSVCNDPSIQGNNRTRRLMFFFLVIPIFLIFACSPKGIQVKSELIKSEESLVPKIQRLEISEDAGRTKLTIQGLGAMSYTVVKLADPPKIVIDIPNADLGKLIGTIEIGNGTINNINIAKFDNKTETVGRIEIALNKMVDYEVAKDTDRLLLYIKKPTEPEGTSVNKTKVKEGETVEGIDFRHTTGKSQIIISTSSKARYNLSRVSEDTLVLELVEMDIQKKLQESLYIKEINSAVELIKPYQTIISGKKTVKIDIKLRVMVPYHIIQEENKIYLDFNQPQEVLHKDITPPPVSAVPRRKVEAAMRVGETQNSEDGFQTEKTEKINSSVESAPVEGGLREKYTGNRISMDFKDADIKNLFRLIAEVSNLNIIFGDDVKGKVTIRMLDVPWDQALDVILYTNNLGMTRAGNIIRIVPSEKLMKEEQVMLTKKKGTEEVEKLFTEIIPINYALAKDILPQIQNKLSKRGKASADERTNSILITEIKGVLKEAKGTIRGLDTPTPQVLIEARIVQSNPTFTQELGIQWGGSYSRGVSSGNYTVSGTAGSNYAINLPSSLIHGGLGAAFVNSSTILDLKLTAMEKDEKVKIISRPKIVTMDNKKAKIEQGVALPFPVMSGNPPTVSTEFKMATLLLEVTPHITPDGSIIMKVLAKKDQKSSQTGYQGEPGIDTRSAETEILVKDGETTVIGGIYESMQTYAQSGVPVLSNIPILGWLFKNKYKKDEVTELLIFITPTIIRQKPVS